MTAEHPASLPAAEAVDLADLPLEPFEPAVPDEARTAFAELEGLSALLAAGALTEGGVWEMEPGVGTDTEADEVFVVLSGAGTVEFLDPARPPVTLRPGTLLRLEEGMQTRWTVTERLRKLYLA